MERRVRGDSRVARERLRSTPMRWKRFYNWYVVEKDLVYLIDLGVMRIVVEWENLPEAVS